MIQHAAAGAATIKGSFQTGFNQRRNKSKQDGRKDSSLISDLRKG